MSCGTILQFTSQQISSGKKEILDPIRIGLKCFYVSFNAFLSLMPSGDAFLLSRIITGDPFRRELLSSLNISN